MGLTLHQRFWFVFGLTLLAVAAAVALGIFGVRQVVRSWSALGAARQELLELHQERQQFLAAKRAFERLEAERELLAASFADPEDPLLFIQSLELLGRRLGVRTKLALAGNGGGTAAEVFQLTVEGPYRSTFAFLKILENLPYLVELGDAEFRSLGVVSGSTAKAAQPLVRLTVTVRMIVPGRGAS